jgi:hypothetical protein
VTAPYELWCWVVEEEDGREGAIAAYVDFPAVGRATSSRSSLVVLQGRNRDIVAEGFAELARKHGEETGRPVRLVHLREVRP